MHSAPDAATASLTPAGYARLGEFLDGLAERGQPVRSFTVRELPYDLIAAVCEMRSFGGNDDRPHMIAGIFRGSNALLIHEVWIGARGRSIDPEFVASSIEAMRENVRRKREADLAVHGASYSRDGARVDPGDVSALVAGVSSEQPEPLNPDASRALSHTPGELPKDEPALDVSTGPGFCDWRLRAGGGVVDCELLYGHQGDHEGKDRHGARFQWPSSNPDAFPDVPF